MSAQPRTTHRAPASAPCPVEEATVRIGGSFALPAVLRKLGADPDTLLDEAGIHPRLFDDADNRIAFAARGRLLDHRAARTGCPHFGLLVGESGDLHDLGLVGLFVKYSPDVATALRSLARYLHLHIRGAATTLVVQGGSATLAYRAGLLATLGSGPDEIVIGAVTYVVLDATPTGRPADIAFVVEEDYQGQGVAGKLMATATDVARGRGVARFEAEVLSGNAAMLSVFRRCGLPMTTSRDGGVIHVALDLTAGAAQS